MKTTKLSYLLFSRAGPCGSPPGASPRHVRISHADDKPRFDRQSFDCPDIWHRGVQEPHRLAQRSSDHGPRLPPGP